MLGIDIDRRNKNISKIETHSHIRRRGETKWRVVLGKPNKERVET